MRAPWLPSLALGALFSLWWCGAVLPDPSQRALGSLYTEAPGHLWSLWGAADRLWASGPFSRLIAADHPRGMAMHLMDPVNLLLFWPVFQIAGEGGRAAVLAWNFTHATWPLIGALGSYQLARRVVGQVPALPWAALVATATTVASPFFLVYHQQGRTEYLPALLYPLHLAFYHRWLRRPAGDESSAEAPPPWVGIAAGLSLAGVALGGWYLAVFAGIVNAALALAWWRGLPRAEWLWRLGLIVVLGVAPTIPAALALLETQGGHFLGTSEAPDVMMATPSDPLLVALHLGSPRDQGMMNSHPYLSLLALALGVYAARRLRGGRWVWPAAAFGTVLFALGPQLYLGGITTVIDGLAMPAGWLAELVPPVSKLRTWSRFTAVGAALLGAGAACGVAALWPRLGKHGPMAAVALASGVLIDHGTWPERPKLAPPYFEPLPPRALDDALATIGPGGVIALPFDVPLELHQRSEEHALWVIWQLHIRRPVSSGFQGEADRLARTQFGKEVTSLQTDCVSRYRHACTSAQASSGLETPPLRASAASTARAEIGAMWLAGFGGLVVAEEREQGGALREALETLLGPPTFDREHVMAWNLRDVALWDGTLPGAVDTVYYNGTVHGKPLLERTEGRK